MFPVIDSQVSIPLVLGSDFASVIFAQVRCTCMTHQDSAMISQKQVLRTQVKAMLRGLSQAELARQSEIVSRHALSLVNAKGFTHIACFLNMDHSEMKTEPLVESLFKQGKTVYLPRCSSTSVSKQVDLRQDGALKRPHLVFYRFDSLAQVQALQPQGKYKLREPVRTDPEPLPTPTLEVILMPGVAFCKKNGARMGHGAGYYDDYISRHIHYTGKKPLLVGLALEEQLVDDVPLEQHDYTVDCLVCGDGTVKWYT